MTTNPSSLFPARGSFHQFSRLPSELRRQIWRKCLPHRIFEIDAPAPQKVYESLGCNTLVKVPGEGSKMKDPPCWLEITTVVNQLPPVVTRVCHEARAVAVESGGPIGLFGDEEEKPEDCKWTSINFVEGDVAWQDFSRDSAHLNWSNEFQFDYGSEEDSGREPLACLGWYTGRLTGTGSLTLSYLRSLFQSVDEDELEFNANEVRKALEHLPRWLVVMKYMVIHADRRTGAESGLFGLLGDAPVQVLDATDERVSAYLSMAEQCESTSSIATRQDFHLDTIEEMKADIQKSWLEDLGSYDMKTDLRPAYMFRLCTTMCNHVDSARPERRGIWDFPWGVDTRLSIYGQYPSFERK